MTTLQDKIDGAKIRVAQLVHSFGYNLSQQEKSMLYSSMLNALCWGKGYTREARTLHNTPSPTPSPQKTRVTVVKLQ